MKKILLTCGFITAIAIGSFSGSNSSSGGGGGGGISSINSDSTAAQTIAGTANISVSTGSGTHTVTGTLLAPKANPVFTGTIGTPLTVSSNVKTDGSGNLTTGTVTNADLAGSIAASKLVGTDIATVGTVTSGTWNGTAIGATYGGTGQTTATQGDILYSSASNTWSKLAAGTSGQFLKTQGAGANPTWASVSPSFPLLSDASGTVSAPDYSFSGATNYGLYKSAADNVALTANGVKYFEAGLDASYGTSYKMQCNGALSGGTQASYIDIVSTSPVQHYKFGVNPAGLFNNAMFGWMVDGAAFGGAKTIASLSYNGEFVVLRGGGGTTPLIGLSGLTSGQLNLVANATTTSHALTFPATQGAANTTLTNDGAGALTWTLQGRKKVDTTAVGNVGAGADDLISYTVPASTLAANKESIEWKAFGTFGATTTATITCNYGGTTLVTLSSASAINNDSWEASGTIIRTGAATQVATSKILASLNGTVTTKQSYTAPTETLSGTVVLKCTGNSSNAADNDIVQKALTVNVYPAGQ